MKILFVFLFSLAAVSSAQEVIRHKTITDCTLDLDRHRFDGVDTKKKAEKICQEYSQKVINCATELAQAKRLTYTFTTALKDCNRVRNPESPNGLNQ